MTMAVVADEDPLAPATWSGSSAYFVDALADRGLVAGTVSAEPPTWVQRVLQTRNFSPDLERWKFKYHLDPLLYEARTRTALRHFRRLDGEARVILQIGAVYDMTGAGLPVVSYHDGNLSRRINSPFGIPRASPQMLQRALAYESRLYGRIERIFTMSRWLADSFIRDFGVPARKLWPIYAGINMRDVDTPPVREEGRHGILFVGKQFDRKGGQVLLDAFGRVRRAVPTATLTIVGPRLGDLGPGVNNPGFLSKQNADDAAAIKRLYSDAAVFVLPTLYEPFGISYVEAMAHGMPCIGTNICAVPEIIEDGVTGRLVAPGDAESLARALIDLLIDPDKARAYGEAGFRKYRQQFTWAKVAERVEEQTRDLCR